MQSMNTFCLGHNSVLFPDSIQGSGNEATSDQELSLWVYPFHLMVNEKSKARLVKKRAYDYQ